MKALDVQDRLEYARAGVAVLRALQITDRTMSYAEFAMRNAPAIPSREPADGGSMSTFALFDK